MFKGLLFCLLACSAAIPATAGGKKAKQPSPTDLSAPILPVSLDFLNNDSALTLRGDVAIRFAGGPAPSLALIDFENRMVERFAITPPPEPIAPATSLYAAAHVPSFDAWRVTGAKEQVTSGANGLFAVRDLLSEHRRPRVHRPTALSASLVLRLDGRSESAPLSIGGGGVAAALWRMMPQ
ncbi:hypothetical protein [Sphingomonas soli]|uniref:hypothetical protein n=1 Tax=Sphingomonas soli TaxID=266127 RepID=UPI00082AD1DC|nr:hypothetical protein [Sphingomonas soli]